MREHRLAISTQRRLNQAFFFADSLLEVGVIGFEVANDGKNDGAATVTVARRPAARAGTGFARDRLTEQVAAGVGFGEAVRQRAGWRGKAAGRLLRRKLSA